jgi:hypothetical protein
MPKTGYAFPDAIGDNIVHLPNYGTNLFRSVTEEQALYLDSLPNNTCRLFD